LELNLITVPPSYLWEARTMIDENDRAALEMKIMKYRALARDAPDKLTAQRIETLVAELEQKRREIAK
jgi:hypothetical protein